MVERFGAAARHHAHLYGDQEHTVRAEQQGEGRATLPPPESGRAIAVTPHLPRRLGRAEPTACGQSPDTWGSSGWNWLAGTGSP